MKQLKKILVTGGTGAIGAPLIKRLLLEGYRVRSFDNDSRGNSKRLPAEHSFLELCAGDIRNLDSLSDACNGIDSIVHLAFVNGTSSFYSKPDLVLDVAIRGMMNVLEVCHQKNIRDLVLVSSAEVYPNSDSGQVSETSAVSIPDVLNPRYSYAGGKLISELLAINVGRSRLDRVCIARPDNVYGPDLGWDHVVPDFIKRAHELAQNQSTGALSFPIQGDGNQTRSFVHIDDLIDGLFRVIQFGTHLEIYNIGNAEEISVRKLAELIVRSIDREALIVSGNEAAGSILRRVPSIQKIKKLGYSPRISFEQGLKETVRWYLKNLDQRI